MNKRNSFENTINELEKIIESLEKDNLTLENSLSQFEKGIKLAKNCQSQLDKVELRVKTILEKEIEDSQDAK